MPVQILVNQFARQTRADRLRAEACAKRRNLQWKWARATGGAAFSAFILWQAAVTIKDNAASAVTYINGQPTVMLLNYWSLPVGRPK
jgi:hypothetical protein